MSKHPQQGRQVSPATPYSLRPGDGIEIEVKVDQQVIADGRNLARFGFSAANLNVPDRRYTTDTCAVAMSESGRSIKIIFAQERVDGSGWRSLLVVHMSREGIARFLTTANLISGPSLEELASANRIEAELLASKFDEPSQAIALSANVVLVAAAGAEACLDFYQASPFSMMAVIASKKIALDPVVRVDLRTSLLLGLLEKFRSLGIKADEFEPQGQP